VGARRTSRGSPLDPTGLLPPPVGSVARHIDAGALVGGDGNTCIGPSPLGGASGAVVGTHKGVGTGALMVAHWDLNNRLAGGKLVVDSRDYLPACRCHELDFLSLLDPVGFPDQISDFFCNPGSELEALLVRGGLSRLDS
jgi:hypothetical protein